MGWEKHLHPLAASENIIFAPKDPNHYNIQPMIYHIIRLSSLISMDICTIPGADPGIWKGAGGGHPSRPARGYGGAL